MVKRVSDEEKKVVKELSVAKLFSKNAQDAYARFSKRYSLLNCRLYEVYYSPTPSISAKFTERDEQRLQRHQEKVLHAWQYLKDMGELEYVMLAATTCIRVVTESQYDKYSLMDAYDTEEVLSTEHVKILRIQRYYLVWFAPLSSL